MRITGLLIFLCYLFSCNASFAQQRKGELTHSRILILLDESSSMVQPWSTGKKRFEAADSLIIKLMDSLYQVNNEVEFSLRVFGHQYPVQDHNCYDTKNEVGFSRDNRTQMALRLADIRPLGVTPIAYALEQAAKYDLTDEQHYAYSIILITDGGESCNGNICDVVQTLINRKVFFKPYIVSLVDYAPLRTEYACLGNYLQLTKEQDIAPTVGTIVDAFRPMLTLSKNDYKELQTVLANPPSALQVNIPPIAVPENPEPQKPAEPVINKPREKENISTIPIAAISSLVVANNEPLLHTVSLPGVPAPPQPEPLPKENRKTIIIAATKPMPPVDEIPYTLKKVQLPALPALAPPPPPALPIAIRTKEDESTIVIAGIKPLPPVDETPYSFKKVKLPALPAPPQPEPLPKEDESSVVIATIKTLPPVDETPYSFKKVSLPALPAPPQPEPLPKEDESSVVIATIKSLPPIDETPYSFKKVSLPALPAPPQPDPLPKEDETSIVTASIKTLPPIDEKAYSLKKVKLPALPAPPQPDPLPKDEVGKITNAGLYTITVAYPGMTLKKVKLPALPPPPQPDPTPKEEVSKVYVTKISRMPLLYLYNESLKPVALPKIPVTKYAPDVPPPVVMSAPKPIVKKPRPKPVTRKPETVIKNNTGSLQGIVVPSVTQMQDAKETSLEVYFEDSKGNTYNTTPEVKLLDPQTGAVVKKFYRTVDASGIPDPQTNIVPGTYDLTITGKKNLIVHNVVVAANKKSKTIVTVGNASLKFSYTNNPGRPVKEFSAIVVQRAMAGGKRTVQKCTDELSYEPGNYFIEINTVPVTRMNVDLDFNSEFDKDIPEPGFIQFTNTNKYGAVYLYCVLGDEYVRFYSMAISGNPAAQKLELKPGQYKVHFKKHPEIPESPEEIMSFTVKPTETTELELK